jgi:hypothetical protein
MRDKRNSYNILGENAEGKSLLVYPDVSGRILLK